MRSLSGNDVIRALKKIGFVFIRQKGSHVKLERAASRERRVVIVPLREDLAEGTLHSISRQALHSKIFESFF